MENSTIKMIFLHLGMTTQESQSMGNSNSLTTDTKITTMAIMETEMGMGTRIIDKMMLIAYQTQRALRVSQTQEETITIINLQPLLIKKVTTLSSFFQIFSESSIFNSSDGHKASIPDKARIPNVSLDPIDSRLSNQKLSGL